MEKPVTFPSISTLMVKHQSRKGMEMHIGHQIKEVFDRQGRRATWFASELNCNRANVYNIFNRENIDVEMLIKISFVLQHNFLRDIAPLADCPKSLDNLPKNSIQDVQNLMQKNLELELRRSKFPHPRCSARI